MITFSGVNEMFRFFKKFQISGFFLVEKLTFLLFFFVFCLCSWSRNVFCRTEKLVSSVRERNKMWNVLLPPCNRIQHWRNSNSDACMYAFEITQSGIEPLKCMQYMYTQTHKKHRHKHLHTHIQRIHTQTYKHTNTNRHPNIQQ
jgi:hypothetical protein